MSGDLQRPFWMQGGNPKPKQPPRSAGINPLTPQASPQVIERATTHRAVVVGVTLIAVMVLFSTFFWVGVGISTVIAPIDASDRFAGVGVDAYLTGGRIILGIITGVLGTVVAWLVADSIID